jgi:hypothetical protein
MPASSDEVLACAAIDDDLNVTNTGPHAVVTRRVGVCGAQTRVDTALNSAG